jgi:hypothetical protein
MVVFLSSRMYPFLKERKYHSREQRNGCCLSKIERPITTKIQWPVIDSHVKINLFNYWHPITSINISKNALIS